MRKNSFFLNILWNTKFHALWLKLIQKIFYFKINEWVSEQLLFLLWKCVISATSVRWARLLWRKVICAHRLAFSYFSQWHKSSQFFGICSQGWCHFNRYTGTAANCLILNSFHKSSKPFTTSPRAFSSMPTNEAAVAARWGELRGGLGNYSCWWGRMVTVLLFHLFFFPMGGKGQWVTLTDDL